MGYQVPRANHPWRRYADRRNGEKPAKKVKLVKVFLEEIIGNWEHIEVYTVAYGREDKFYLFELPQTRQAAWIAGLLKKSYA
jgi:hypothetical protein